MRSPMALPLALGALGALVASVADPAPAVNVTTYPLLPVDPAATCLNGETSIAATT